MARVSTYWVRFKPGVHWISRFLKKGYGHVTLISEQDDKWIFIDPAAKIFEWKVLDITTDVDIIELFSTSRFGCQTPIFQIVIHGEVEHLGSFWSCFSCSPCVSFVKYALGLRTWTMTPYGLCKRLKKLSTTFLIMCL